jgi:hypothetical protein
MANKVQTAPGKVHTVSGKDYEKWIKEYINTHFNQHGLAAFNQVTYGRHSLGVPHRNDIFVTNKDRSRVLFIECKTQDKSGSKDEAMIHAIESAESDPNRAVVYRGNKFSNGVWNRFLQSKSSWFCSPNIAANGKPLRFHTKNKLKEGGPVDGDTWELDQLLFFHFRLIDEWMKDDIWNPI